MKFELIRDLRAVQRGWRWGGVRPASWPEPTPGVPEPASNLDWARQEPIRGLRWLVQRGLSVPFTRAVTGLRVDGDGWLREQDRPALLVSNHVSHADTPILLAALPDRARERTVVGAAADYWYARPWLGRLVSLWLNTFPFSRTGGAQAVLHSSSVLLRSGWNLLIYPEGSRSPDGRMQPFQPGVGHLANETRSPVVPVHVRGTHRVMPKGRRYFLPAPVDVRFGKPLEPGPGEGSRAFTQRVEEAVRELGRGSGEPEVVGSWIERWRASAPRSSSRR
ncbi:MAG TPA: lysophospholipid acyltransferase family protein [Candidatus Dormibacteraeota bacterium]|nr:lysophospholipid acyltransferase family protein [Candidatus Dormibacteraeota bacterium]